MATTTYGTSYATSADLVSAWPAASLLVANSVDAAGYYIGRGINAQTASYVGILTDAGKTVTMTVATSNTFTIPPNSSVAYPTGTRINILNLGAGACTVTAGAGVTISGTVSALAINASAAVIKTATNTWSYIAEGGGGKILQAVSATTSTAVSTTSGTYVTTGITATITPSSASSKVLILCNTGIKNALSPVAAQATFSIFRGTVAGTNLGDASYGMGMLFAASGTDLRGFVAVNFLDSPSTTSAQVYTLGMQCGSTSNTITSSAFGSLSSIILMEVGA